MIGGVAAVAIIIAAGYFFWPAGISENGILPEPQSIVTDDAGEGQLAAPSPVPAGSPPAQTVLVSGGDLRTYQSADLGLSFRYPDRYFVSWPVPSSTSVIVRLYKTADRAKVDNVTLEKIAELEFARYTNPLATTVQGLAQLWGESFLGIRFRTAEQCKDITVASEPALRCSLYAGTDRGGYRTAVFTMHGDEFYRFSVSAPKSDDPAQTDFGTILASIRWND